MEGASASRHHRQPRWPLRRHRNLQEPMLHRLASGRQQSPAHVRLRIRVRSMQYSGWRTSCDQQGRTSSSSGHSPARTTPVGKQPKLLRPRQKTCRWLPVILSSRVVAAGYEDGMVLLVRIRMAPSARAFTAEFNTPVTALGLERRWQSTRLCLRGSRRRYRRSRLAGSHNGRIFSMRLLEHFQTADFIDTVASLSIALCAGALIEGGASVSPAHGRPAYQCAGGAGSGGIRRSRHAHRRCGKALSAPHRLCGRGHRLLSVPVPS